jgi:NADH-quinone oxidoreductase subunit M
VVGILLLGPVKNDEYLKFSDATWFEKLSTGVLIAVIAGIGIAPLWLSDMINESLHPFILQLSQAIIP